MKTTVFSDSRAHGRRYALGVITTSILLWVPALPQTSWSLPLFDAGFLSFDVKELPRAVVSADFNEDGRPDLAVSCGNYFANIGGSYVSILLGSVDGSFDERTDIPVGREPLALIAADLNRDGHLDLAVACESGVALLIGRGNGSFLTGASLECQAPESLVAGDLNGDGNPDLIVSLFGDSSSIGGSGEISTFLGRGDGSFTPIPPFRAGPRLALADFDGDGRLDIAVTLLYVGGVSILRGNGDGTFDGAPDPAGVYPGSIAAAADFDLDGRIDLCTRGPEPGVVSTLRGRGDGTFDSPRASPTGSPYLGRLSVADLNADRVPDLILGSPISDQDQLFILLGHGDGTFSSPSSFPTGPGCAGIVEADFNGDGRIDVLSAAAGAKTVSLLLGTGTGAFGGVITQAPFPGPRGVALADLDRDDRPDLIVASASVPSLSVLLGSGGGQFGRRLDYTLSASPRFVACADVNSDGHVDIATTNTDWNSLDLAGTLSILLGTGDGALAPPTQYATTPFPWMVRFEDTDGDGNLDAIVPAGEGGGVCFAASPTLGGQSNFSNFLSILKGAGDGTFLSRTDVGDLRTLTCVGVADLNHDGKRDLVAGSWGTTSRSGSLLEFIGNGDGTYGPPTAIAGGVNPIALEIADLNADSWPDIVVANSVNCVYDGSISVVLGVGGGAFGPPQTYATPGGIVSVAVGDLDGDGRLDVAGAASHSNTIDVLLGNGDGTLGHRTDFGCGGAPTSVAIGDIDGDGRNDLVSANSRSGDVSILLNRRGAPATLPARAFLRHASRTIPLGAGPPMVCVLIEPGSSAFSAVDIDPKSVTLSRSGYSTSARIATQSKMSVLGDGDGDGVTDVEACFTREALASLFQGLRGRKSVAVNVLGSLLSGRRFHAELELEVVGTGKGVSSRVAPNPMNPQASIFVSLSEAGPITVQIFDSAGHRVRTLRETPPVSVNGAEIKFDGLDDRGASLSSGIYFYRVDSREGETTGRMAVLR